MAELAVYDNDPTLYLFTSLTAGSSHIITATSRIETILKANKIPFKGVDTATDELARKLYGRRARGKKLPLLVKEGYVIADLEQVEEWNEYDELKEALGGPSAPAPPVAVPLKAAAAQAATPSAASKPAESAPAKTPEQNLAIRQLGAEAAKVAASKKPVPEKIATTNPLLAEKVNSPATGTPTKAGAGPASILSPKSIPLPATPSAASPKSPIPKIASKPVHAPPSMHADASNPELAAGPISSTAKSAVAAKSPLSPASPGVKSPETEFHGRRVSSPGAEEIKRVEKQQSIAEADSSEEEDDEDDDDNEEDDEEEDEDEGDDEDDDEDDDDEDEDEEDDEEEDEDESEEEDEKGASTAAQPKKTIVTVKPKVDDKAAKAPAQSAKTADKAGKSVKK